MDQSPCEAIEATVLPSLQLFNPLPSDLFPITHRNCDYASRHIHKACPVCFALFLGRNLIGTRFLSVGYPTYWRTRQFLNPFVLEGDLGLDTKIYSPKLEITEPDVLNTFSSGFEISNHHLPYIDLSFSFVNNFF